MRKIIVVMAMLMVYTTNLLAVTDFLARPELTVDESNPVVYAIVNYRGDCYSVRGDSMMTVLKANGFGNRSVLRSAIDRSTLWYFTDAGNEGMYIHSLEYSEGAITGTRAILNNVEDCAPYYILENTWSHGKGMVICTLPYLNGDSNCLDASATGSELSSGWSPIRSDWEGACWFFIKVDPDDLGGAQKACEEAFAENHYIPPFVTYQGLKFVVNDDSGTCRVVGRADDSMTTLTIPEVVVNEGATYTVASIGKRAFYNMSDLTGDLVIPNTVREIDAGAFVGCRGFNGTLTLGSSISLIGEGAFSGCTGFTGDLIIPDSVTEIEEAAFRYCSGFDGTLTLSNTLDKIETWVFWGCSGFTGNLVIPESVTEICWASCHGTGFTGLIIPNSVTKISGWAFRNCPNLASKSCLVLVPPVLGDEAFDEGSTIAVPEESLALYKADEQWSQYILVGISHEDEREITLSQSVATLEVGETLQLTATVEPADDVELSWISLNVNIASVSDNGLVTAVAPGSTAILVSLSDGMFARCDVTVINPNSVDSVSDDSQIKVSGRSIEAPAGSRVITPAGVEVNGSNLEPGTYIVLLPTGTPVKVMIK